MTSQVQHSLTVSSVRRWFITTLEPISAVSGALMVFFDPDKYISVMSRHGGRVLWGPTHVYTALGGGWLFLGFIEAVVLRYCNDLRLWKLICLGLLLSDLVFTHAAAQAVGGWAEWADLSSWSFDDYIMFSARVPAIMSKVFVVLGW